MDKMYKIIFVFELFVLVPLSAHAATLNFSPQSGSYNVGSTLSVNVIVDSSDQAMNAASGVISFPSDKLEVTSISKTGSIFTLWVQEPSFSNSAGTVNFEGIVLNPGFTGSNGKVITITFKTKAAGNAPLTFSSGSVLANDGKGTNILTGMGDAHFSIGTIQPGAPEIITPIETVDTPPAPVISSLTHPDPNKWYAVSRAQFNWNVPNDTTAVRLLVGKVPNAIPTITYTSPINSKEIADVADGIWYFSVRLKNNADWGAVSHFRFQIDTTKPSRFNITEITRKDTTEPKVAFTFDAKDDVSGIDHYEIQIDGGNTQTWHDDGTKTYTTSALKPGTHVLIAKAIDKAGNSLANSVDFVIEPLNAPTITEYPKELQSGEPLIVRGSTYPNSTVTIWLQKEKDNPQSFTVQSDGNGNFTFIADEKLGDGTYRLWAEVANALGAQSLPSEKVVIAIAKTALLQVGSWAVSLLAVVIPLVALIFILLYIVWYGWHTLTRLRKRIRKEVLEVESTLHRAFDILQEDIREQIKLLEKTRGKRELTKEEDKIVKQLKKDLETAEKFVKKEIEDIENEVT
jgi:hypothetical protein